MNDLILGTRVTGDIVIDGESIFADSTDVIDLRKRVGMVFQKPNPFRSRYTRTSPSARTSTGWAAAPTSGSGVERALRAANIWEEVKDRLHDNAFSLSGANSSGSAPPAACRSSRR